MSRRRLDPDVARAIQEALVLGYTPSRVLSRLQAADRLRDRVPSLRTIESMAAELRGRDRSDTWTVGEADPDDVPLVLPVLAELVMAGQATSVTRETGRWIAVLRRVAPAMPTIDVLIFASRYQAAMARGDSTHLIDLELARHIAKRPPG